ncbi:hypothetical protein UVI_02005060 [Ustilaginoidea virens]|uniref:Uncharacterized protein n=1 Tax=Ustilaginoidea virens TaxID=1159556 RepID=A0A1B5KUV1_USTVR|nr:hypothetical protein UVI_02005060 [Ustilaginoidea virens]
MADTDITTQPLGVVCTAVLSGALARNMKASTICHFHFRLANWKPTGSQLEANWTPIQHISALGAERYLGT